MQIGFLLRAELRVEIGRLRQVRARDSSHGDDRGSGSRIRRRRALQLPPERDRNDEQKSDGAGPHPGSTALGPN